MQFCAILIDGTILSTSKERINQSEKQISILNTIEHRLNDIHHQIEQTNERVDKVNRTVIDGQLRR